jgi:anaerobic ribonucleoside-triphosphate reductase activating protein
MSEDLLLNVAATMARSRSNGPGLRAVVWAQGCTIGCPGCYNSSTHPHVAESLYSPSEIASWVLSIDGIEGVTFSGGEPFEQAAAISQTISLIQEKKPYLSIFTFTGFDFQTLKSSTDDSVQKLLAVTDIISSGPFISKLRDSSLLWRGSSNQELHYLTERYSSKTESIWNDDSPYEEYHMHQGLIHFTGFGGPGSNNLKTIVQQLSVTD